MKNSPTQSVWWWIPTLYFSQGLPYVAVMTLSVILYKNLGLSNTEIALYTSWLYLPFVIKPLWAPFIELFKTKRWWVIALELLIGGLFASVAFSLSLPGFFQASLAAFWLLAFAGATHDVSSDGFYMLGLNQHEQAAYVGIRSTFFRLSMLTGQGALVYLAGRLTEHTGNAAAAWALVFYMMGAVFVGLSVYHRFMLPRPAQDVATTSYASIVGVGPHLEDIAAAHTERGEIGERPAGILHLWASVLAVFRAFFVKPGVGTTLAFLLLYRFGESQLVKLAPPFLLDSRSKGGLEMSTANVGIVYGTLGIVALTMGGLLSAYLASRDGLKRWLWPMALAINVPNVVYVFLAAAQPQDLLLIGAAVVFEQLGYGFGFTAFILYMIMTADGPHKTAHYALCTGFMAMGMMLPGMVSGFIQAQLGYLNFFVWVCVATIPSFVVTGLIRVDPSFGRKQA